MTRSASTSRSPKRLEAERVPDAPGLAVRAIAAKLLAAVVDARTSLDGLLDPVGGHPGLRRLDARDQGLVRAILHVALRRRGTIAAALAARVDRPLPGNARALEHLLHVGAAQVLFLDVPDSAAVDTAVSLAKADPRLVRFAGLVNALLRRLAREKEVVLAQAEADPARDCPPWLFERLAASHGDERARRIAALLARPAPLDLTVLKGDAAAFASQLGGDLLPTGSVRLPAFDGPVTALPGFAEGAWIVQDAAASLPARLFGAIEGQAVADLCAAPGGKTAQLAARGARVTAVDRSASRMKRLEDNFGRLGLPVETRVGEFATLDLPSFDAVLLDAPCSSTGTLRRHPDVGYTKNAEEVTSLAGVQARLLREAADLVKPGGTLVFSNCSLDAEEGEGVVAGFLAERGDFALDRIRTDELPGLSEAVTADGMVRTLPDMLDRGTPDASGLDGFFAARLKRAAA